MTRILLFTLLFVLSDSAFGLDPETSRLVDIAKSGSADDMYRVFFTIASRGTAENPVSKRDGEIATHWLIQAGEHNSMKAAYILQTCYRTGCMGVPIDKRKALHYKKLVGSKKGK